jgi:hypothetical protein
MEKWDFDCKFPWSKTLVNCARAICSAVQVLLNAAFAQIVFGRKILYDLLILHQKLRSQRIHGGNLEELSI